MRQGPGPRWPRGASAEFWGGGIAGAARTEDDRILEGVDRLLRGHSLHGLRSDRDGMLALPLLPRIGFEMKVRIRAGNAVSEKFDVHVDTEPTDVVVR